MKINRLFAVMMTLIVLSFTAQSQNATALNFSAAGYNVVETTDPGFGTSDFTIELWFRPSSITNGDYLASNRTYDYNAPGSWWVLHKGSGITLETGISNMSSQLIVQTPTNIITQGAWNHVALVRSGLTYSIFVNGVFQVSATEGSVRNLTSGSGIMRMGGWREPNLAYYDGDMDEIRTWSIARAATDIAASAACELDLTATQTGLTRYFRLNQGIAAGNNTLVTVATDDSPSAQNASLVNFSLNGASSNWVAGGPVVVTPTISVSDATICSGVTTTIIPSGTDNYTISGSSFTVAPQTTSSYSITGASAAGCAASNTAVVNIFVNATPTVAVSDVTICSGNTATLVPSGADTYTISGGSFSVAPQTTTSYSVTGTSTDGCISTNAAVATVSVYTTPTVAVSSGSVCTGGSFTLMPGGADTYTISGGTFTVSPSSDQSYSVTGTSTDGCVSTTTTVATVSVYALPTVAVSDGSVCTGESFTLVPTGADTYTISGGTFIVSPASDQSYSITGTSTDGCVSTATAVATVSVYTTPTVAVSSGSICSGESFTLTPSGADTYTISGGSFTVTPASNNSYSVTGTSTDGCIASNVAVVTITVAATPTISVSNATICSGGSISIVPSGADTYTISGGNFTVTPASNTSYSITGTSVEGCVSSNTAVASISLLTPPTVSVNNATVCSGASAVIIPSGAFSYTITGGSFAVTPTADASYSITGASMEGCPSSNTVVSMISVNTTPTISVNNPVVCAGNSAVIVSSGADTFTISGGSFTVSPATTTDYSVTGTATNGCVSSEVISTVSINALPAISVTAGRTAICVGETTSLTASGAASYSWSTSETAAVIAVSPTMNTTYTLTGTDANGCANTTTITEATDVCTGIKQNQASLIFSVYPNPNAGEFVIKTASQAEIVLINSVGQIVLSQTTNGTDAAISMTHLANGIYFVKAVSNGQQQMIRIVKE